MRDRRILVVAFVLAAAAVVGALLWDRAPRPEQLPEVVEIRLDSSVALVVRVRHEDPSVRLDAETCVSFDVDEAVVASTGSSDFNEVRGSVPVSGGGSGVHQTRCYAAR